MPQPRVPTRGEGVKGVVVNVEQRSPEWYAARAGRLTGSRAGDMLSRIKSGEAAGRRNLRVQLVCERLTQRAQDDTFSNRHMRKGSHLEPMALAAYEGATGVVSRKVGFVQHETIMAGCSPDGVIGDEGLVELKCPLSATHLDYLKGKRVPPEYRPQVTHNLWITGANWCDFVSFDENFPKALQLFMVRVRRDELDIEGYEGSALKFLSEVDEEFQNLSQMIEEKMH